MSRYMEILGATFTAAIAATVACHLPANQRRVVRLKKGKKMRVGLRPDVFLYKNKKMFTAGYDYSDIPTLFESDDVNCGDLIRFEDKVYAIGMVSRGNNFALARLVNINNAPEEEVSDDYLKCPVCGGEDHDSWELNNEDEKYECGSCGAILSYTSEVTRAFCVSMKKMPEIKSAIPGAERANGAPEDGPCNKPKGNSR